MELIEKLNQLKVTLNLAEREIKMREIETQMATPTFWENPSLATKKL